MLLRYDISITGAQAVDRALASIERRFIAHNQRVNRALAQGGGSSRVSSTGRAGAATTSVEREIRQQEQYWRRAHQRSADNRIREENRASAAAIRNADREAKARSRADAAAAKHRARSEAQAAKEALAARRKFTSSTFGVVGSSVKGTLAATGAIGGTALGLAGGFAAAGAVQAEMSERAAASRLANQAGDPGLKEGLLKDARGVRGFSGGEALSGMEEFVTKTGDLATARAIIGDLGTLALATGTDLGDLGATAGQAFNVLKDQIEDPVERIRQLNLLMGVLAQQGAMGAVEIRDLARDFGKLGAATRSFEGDAPELLRSMGAFAQIAVARGGAESSADASTAASRLANDIVMHKERFKGLGVDIKSKKDPTKLRAPIEILADTLEATGGDIEKTTGLFGLESGKIFKGLGATFSEAEKKQKGSGRAAVMAEFGRFSGAELDSKQLAERARSRLEDPDLQFKEVMKDFNQRVGTELMPTLTRLIPEFAKLLPYVERAAHLFGKMVDAFAQDPFAGLAKIVAAKLAFDIAIASAGSAAKKLTDSLGDVAAKVAGAVPGGSALGGVAGSAGLAAQIGLSAATVILTAGIVNFEKREADIKATGAEVNAARVAASQGNAEEVTRLRMSAEERLSAAKKPGLSESLLGGAIDLASLVNVPALVARAAGADIGADKVAKGVVGDTIDQTRDSSIKSQEKMVETLRQLELQADLAAKNLAKVAGTTLNRGNSPSPVVNK